jgi:hypothetical protein
MPRPREETSARRARSSLLLYIIVLYVSLFNIYNAMFDSLLVFCVWGPVGGVQRVPSAANRPSTLGRVQPAIPKQHEQIRRSYVDSGIAVCLAQSPESSKQETCLSVEHACILYAALDGAPTSTKKHAACTNGVRAKDCDFWTNQNSMIPRETPLFGFTVKMVSETPKSIC